jgi:hypothetical protein
MTQRSSITCATELFYAQSHVPFLRGINTSINTTTSLLKSLYLPPHLSPYFDQYNVSFSAS